MSEFRLAQFQTRNAVLLPFFSLLLGKKYENEQTLPWSTRITRHIQNSSKTHCGCPVSFRECWRIPVLDEFWCSGVFSEWKEMPILDKFWCSGCPMIFRKCWRIPVLDEFWCSGCSMIFRECWKIPVLLQFWCSVQAVLLQFRCSVQAVLLQFWCSVQAVLLQFCKRTGHLCYEVATRSSASGQDTSSLEVVQCMGSNQRKSMQ